MLRLSTVRRSSLYINGVQEGSVASTTPITVNTLPLAIGAQSDNSRWFGGLMDDARVYATALSASQIAALATPPSAPVATADSYSTSQNTALVQPAPGVLSNDTDADSDPLTAVLNATVTHGTLSLNANGGFTYTPTAGYSGPDSFTYHANDGTADSNVVTVSLTVNAAASTSISGTVSKAGGAGPLVGSYVTVYEATTATWTTTASPTPAGPMPSTCRRAATSYWSRPTRRAIPTVVRRLELRHRHDRRGRRRRDRQHHGLTQHLDLGHRQQGRWSRPAGRLVRDRL